MNSRTQLISKCIDSGRIATPQRMTIIDELFSSGKNLSAYDLRDSLKGKGHALSLIHI